MNNTNIERIYPLTSMQEGMLYHHLLDERSNSYFVQDIVRINGQLDVNIVETSLYLLAKKHAVLRTSIFYKNVKQPRQIVLKERAIGLVSIDISHLVPEERAESFEVIKREDLEKQFDLEKDVLMRVIVVKMAENEYKMIWSFHHIIMDGWCMSLVVKDFMQNYDALKNGVSIEELSREIEVSSRNIAKYEDYIKWLAAQNKGNALNYWAGTLVDYFQETGIEPMQIAEKVEKQVDGVKTMLSKETSEKVKKLTHQLNVTINTVVEAAWGILLQRYNGTNDAVFGKVVSGRNANIKGIEQTVGLFINTVPVRVDNKNDTNFIEIIKQLQEQAIESSLYDYCSLSEIQEQSNLKGKLIKTIIAFENYYVVNDSNEFGELSFEVESLREQTNYPITLVVYLEDTLCLEIMYNPSEYSEQEAEKVLANLSRIISVIAEAPDKKISEMEVLLEAEKNQILFDFNDTKTAYPKDKTIHELFEEQVRMTPHAEAVVCPNERLTYDQLDRRSNEIKGEMIRKGVREGELIGIVSEKSVHMIAGILAILKCGCGYVPIDRDYPESRLRFMLEDCDISTILCGAKNIHHLEHVRGQRQVIDIQGQYEEYKESYNGTAHDVAYVIYTSGSTGQPKGVVVEHHNVVRLVKNTNYVDFEDARILQIGALSFDAATFEIWGALLNGGMVCLVEADLFTASDRLSSTIQNHNINIMFMTTQLFNNLIDMDQQWLDGLRTLLIGGEKLSEKHVNKVLEHRQDLQFINCYGPTENTTFSVCLNITREYNNIPIGKPISNSTAYIMNGNMLSGIGLPGELCVGGDGVARGYLNRDELTLEKFVDNPYVKGERMYRTGDLARWLPDGNIEYLGRMDEQVKIRGYRIELGEIESVIRRQAEIRDVAVIAREDRSGDKYLCAYVVSADQTKEIKLTSLKNELRRDLPEYMIPSCLVNVEQLPVTINGKLDRRALPDPEILGTREYAAPRNELEETLVNIFQEVLGLEQVSIHDSFFEIGGHSLKATRVVNLIESAVGVRLPLKTLFERTTVVELCELLHQGQERTYEAIPQAEKQAYYPMSSAQRRMYVIHELEDLGTVYNMPGVTKIEGELKLDKIKDVFQKLTQRHESLRTSFHMIDGEPVQRIEEQVEIEVAYEEVEIVYGEEDPVYAEIAVTCEEATDIEKRKATAAELLQEFVRPFHLGKAPLLRAKVVKYGSDKNLLMFDMHHIISDGATVNIISKEFSQLYNGEELEALDVQYKDYSEWMRKKDISNQEAYWIDQLSDEIPVLELPLDYVRPQIQQFSGSSFDVRIHTGTKEMLKDLCAETGTTEYMVLLSSFMVLLNKYSRQEDIIVGSPISGRTHQDTENMVGMFVNTLAMRGKPEGHKSFSSFLAEIREICLKGYENQEYPFEDIVEKISVKRDMSRNPLFDVLFVLHNHEEEKVSVEGLQFGTVETGSTVAKFDLTLTLSSHAEGYVANWEYSNKLFEQETIRRMAEHFSHLLDKILETPDKKISEIEMITEVEKNQVLFDFNDTKTAYPKDKTIHELFETQVGQTPHAEAVVCPNERFTYDQLDRRSNEIRGEMLRKGVREGELIGIVSEKSVHMIAGILAILKCGCGYVPIDRDYPESRLQFMLEDCDINTILCGTKNIHHLKRVRGQRQIIDIQGQYEQYKESYNGTAHDIAYVIYTSGSTGQPKGVVVEHQNVVRLVKNTSYMDFEGARILQTGALSFDAATFEIWGALLNGGMLCLVEADSVTVGEKLSSTIQNQNINMMWMTSQLFNNLIDMDQQWLAGLRTLLIGGEKLSEKHVNKLLQHRQDIQLINGYGPTENTTFSVCLNITKEYNKIPIGKPISNSTAYIMNGNTLSGIGMPGELCVGGDGVARGYLNRDELTREKFVDNPYVKGERMYRTGDLARWLPDGNIEYLGRMDEQVKIRGYRIELGEIESVIRRQEGVRDVAVITTEDHAGDKYICAYVVSEDQEKEINTAEMRSALKKELPEYMIPSYLVSMDQLPVTTNGKLDRRMLPLPEVTSTQEYVAPRNELEETLVHIFSEVLGLEQIGIDDNFFEMGGDSIKAIRIISKVREHGFELDIRTLVQERDIRNISSKVEKVQFDHLEEYQQPVEGLVQWTPIQHEFIGWELSKPGHFNQAVMIHSSEKLNVDHIHSTLKHLTMHHDALRSVFDDDGTQRIRSVDEPDMYDLAIYNYQDLENEKALEQIVEEHCNEMQGSIDLKNGPLMKVGLFDTLDGMHIFICIHHLVVDGVSWRILLEDFNTVYTQLINHEEVNLPLKTASYQKWSEGLITFGESYLLRRELPYWKTILDKTESMTSISKSLKLQSLDEEDHRNSEVYNQEFELSMENTNKLIYDCSKAYNTEINDLLLAALSITVSRCFGLKSVAIELESHGRHPIEPQVCVDRTVGWFTNIYPVILECQTDDIGTTIRKTKDMLRNVPNHGLGYGILKFLTENELKEHSGSHVEVNFNYLGDISSSEGGVFNFSKLNSGKMSSDENRINKLITVDGILQDSQLAFTIGYNGSIHDHDAVQFCDCFKLSLNDVITHCSNSNETQYTISDYGNDIEWSDSELEDVLKLFEGDEEN